MQRKSYAGAVPMYGCKQVPGLFAAQTAPTGFSPFGQMLGFVPLQAGARTPCHVPLQAVVANGFCSLPAVVMDAGGSQIGRIRPKSPRALHTCSCAVAAAGPLHSRRMQSASWKSV